MENKKVDINTVIGYVLIAGLLFWMIYTQQSNLSENPPKEDNKQTEVVQDKPEQNTTEAQSSENQTPQTPQNDSIRNSQLQTLKGSFDYANINAEDNLTTLENEVIQLKISNKGGQVVEAKMKQFDSYKGDPIYLLKNDNAKFNIQFQDKSGRLINTADYYFTPKLTETDNGQRLSMKLKVSEDQYLEYVYQMNPNDYMLDFDIYSQGLKEVVNTSQNPQINWFLKAYRHAKSISYENRYTEIVYQYDGDKDDYTSQGDVAEEEEKLVDWIAYKQHFFTSILLNDQPFEKVKMISRNLVQDDEVDTLYTKSFESQIPLKFKNGEIVESMNFYYGPADYKVLKKYDRNLDEIVPTGWGIFGWINENVFIPFFEFLSSVLPSYGLAIILMTIVVRIVLSPLLYKSYLSQAKMKVLRPEINEINEKYKDNAMKRQQETMTLYSKTGVSPMSGCLPGLLQIPVFYALFQFFPSAFVLRQKSFLWAEDLSSYDSIASLPFHIPFYGDHVSLFPILASIAIFIYMTMTTGQNMQTSQPGMPNMKIIMYISPVVMLIFFNNYASGLSLYYFISNLITIGIMLVIKNYIIDENRILAKIEANKKKPKKKGKFAQRMQDMMKQAEEQKRLKNKK
ncbi:membrane protein insertase YidC [Flavobacterium sp. CS20]|uniref:membrane protein insertase YidC n=1 Tax=Flavobacterium sp. CS20 TaxID=2775246 RepID=UPI001B3A1FBC|nr:membrane protein insertase YidC [Flavobacterium sp. CS20]QTY27485.1 membrane protein insertase YidC [Flavobacterium sp. CS20]